MRWVSSEGVETGKAESAALGGRPVPQTSYLQPAKPTEVIWRGLYGIEHGGSAYVVEVDFFDFSEKVRLYCNGSLVAEERSPACFSIEQGASIEASMSLYGMKRAHLIEKDGRARTLVPLPGTAEAWRLSFDRRHPIASKAIAVISWTVLAVALVTQIPNLLNSLANGITLIGLPRPFTFPALSLPDWANVLLAIFGLIAGLDRGMRMVHNPLLDD